MMSYTKEQKNQLKFLRLLNNYTLNYNVFLPYGNTPFA